MRAEYPTDFEPATPEYVLAVFRDQHRQTRAVGEAGECELSFETSIDEWRDAFADETIGGGEWARALSHDWGLELPEAEWRAVQTPQREKRLRGVCELIARHVSRPIIRPARLLGTVCEPAGAFLTVRAMLVEAGARARMSLHPRLLWLPTLAGMPTSSVMRLVGSLPGRSLKCESNTAFL